MIFFCGKNRYIMLLKIQCKIILLIKTNYYTFMLSVVDLGHLYLAIDEDGRSWLTMIVHG